MPSCQLTRGSISVVALLMCTVAHTSHQSAQIKPDEGICFFPFFARFIAILSFSRAVFRFGIQMAGLMLEIQREAQLRAEARAGARAPGNDAEVKRQVIAQVEVAANLRLQLLLAGVELACEGARHLRAQV